MSIKVYFSKKSITKLICNLHYLCELHEKDLKRMTEKVVRLNVNLQNESAKKFQEIKQKLGLHQNTEVIRTLVNFYFEHEIQKEA